MAAGKDSLSSARKPRLGVALDGDPFDPTAWSGIVANLIGGLRGQGATIAPVRAEFPPLTRINAAMGRGFADQAGSKIDSAVATAAASFALRRHRPLDGVVQIGSGYLLPPGTRLVTWEDMTVVQATSMPDETYAGLSATAVARWKARQQKIYERARACCVASHWARDSVTGDYGISSERVHVVGFGRNAQPTEVERDWSVPRFLFVGREWERKNGPAVLRAFARLREEVPEARLDLVGGHPPIDVGGVTGHGFLRFGVPDDRERYARLLREATCFVMPSLYEPLGVAYLDAGATGLPSVGTTVGGAAEAIGGGGLLVDPGDEQALREALRRMCDPELARRLGREARRNSDRFTWDLVAQRVLRALAPEGLDLASLAPFLSPLTPETVR